MSKKTEPYDACAASVQTIGTKAEFQTDSLMQNLSRENLNELFPGAEHLKLRKTIYEILHDQKQTHQFLKNLEDFVQQDSLNDAAVTEYLQRINNINDELDEMQTVLEAHKMKKDIKKSQVSQKEPDVQTDSGIQTPQEEPYELLAGRDDLNIQKTTSHLQEERVKVTQQDSHRASSTEDETVLTLLQEIEKNNPEAASVLKVVGIQTDSEIKSLTPEDLNELFPDKLEFRKIIFQIINKKKPTDQLLEEPDVAQRKFLMDECLRKIMYTKKQLDEAFTEAHVNTAENFWKQLDFKKDAHFQTLTREGLQKLFPGRNNFNLRKTMFEILHNLPKDLLLGERGDVTQQEAAEADYSVRIKNMKDQLDRMTAVIEKGYSPDSSAPMTTNKKQHKNEKGKDSSRSRWSLLNWFSSSQKPSVTVKYKMVVCGQTFGAHLQLLDQIKASGLNLIEINDEERCIIIVFCPVVCRIRTDAEAAMKMVPGDDPVILVLMHHSQEPKGISSPKVLTSYSNVILEVHIFYHDRKNGLLACEQNKNAVIELRKTLTKSQITKF